MDGKEERGQCGFGTRGGGDGGSLLVEFGLLEMSELEYGEGKDIEDKSHNSRLLNKEEGGAGANREVIFLDR
jgi:hypothetical protein